MFNKSKEKKMNPEEEKNKNEEVEKTTEQIDTKNAEAEKQIIDEITNLHEEFNKKEDKIIELENEVKDLNDRLLRRLAEFENFKKRTENEQANLIKYSAESFIKKILPVIDDFERSIKYIKEATEIAAVKEGIILVYEKLIKTLEDQGITKIESIGKPFDFEVHEAVMQKPEPTVEALTVLDEIETGYMYKDRVIRHSKVIVSSEIENDYEENTKEN